MSKHRTPEQWQALVDQQRDSGLSAPQFCSQQNIGYASFCKWRNRISALSIALADSSASSDEASFLDLSSLMGAPCDLPHLQCRLSASLLCVHHRERHPWVCGGYSGYDPPHECYW